MQKIPFTLPVSGVLRIEGGQVTFIINRMETNLDISIEASPRRMLLEEGLTLSDLALEAAREIVAQKGFNRFQASEIFHQVQIKYPDIKRNSLTGRIIASTVNHPSSKNFGSRRDFFRYGGNGIFMISEKYMTDASVVNRSYLSEQESKVVNERNEQSRE